MATNKSTKAKTSNTKKATTVRSGKAKPKITADAIRRRAAEIYHQRMQHGTTGDELSDWLQAEKELKSTK